MARVWLGASIGLLLAGCAAPPDVVDLGVAPEATLVATRDVRIVPLGVRGPSGVTSVGPVVGFGCEPSVSGAASDAMQQLQVKALGMQAVAVVDVAVARDGPCFGGYGVAARGDAVSEGGFPRPW
jgi:hypothetical protein